MKTLLRAENLGKKFANQGPGISLSQKIKDRLNPGHKELEIFQGLNFQVQSGVGIALHGGNGVGKSTLLRILGGVLHQSEGKVIHEGKTLALLSHGLGAYEELPVWRNAILVMLLLGMKEKEAEKHLKDFAAFSRLEGRMYSPCTQLSEGMRAKIPLCALRFAPFDLLLLDESLSHVDAEFRASFHELTRQWIKEGRSFLLSSHDAAVLEHFGTKHWHLGNGKLSTD